MLLHRSVHPNKAAIIEEPKFIIHLLTTQFLTFARKFGASKNNKLVLCVDSKPTWRMPYYETHSKKFPEYKGTKLDPNEWRTYKGNRTKDLELPWNEIYQLVDELLESLKLTTDFFVVKVEEAEADDIIAILSKHHHKDEKIWAVSSDKDFVQLQIYPNVEIFDPIKQAFKPEQDIEIYKQIHFSIGDASDNILAIRPRLGEKTAIKILKDIPDLLATNPDMKERYEFNKKLIDFSEIPSYIEENILTEFSNQSHNFNSTNLLKTFMKFGMSKLSESINEFCLPDKEIKTTLNQHFITAKRNEALIENNLEDFFS